MKRRIPLAPEEGWLTLGLVLLMCLALAWSVDSVKWVLGREKYLDYLVFAAAGGVLVGFIGPKVGWGRWLTYLIGCILAALIVPLLTGLIAYPNGAPLHVLYKVTADSAAAAWVDIAILNKVATIQFLHHVLIIGLLMWATAMFASYAVFGHRRALNAVVILGVLLVLNMSYTRIDQLPLFMVFCVASLFLLIRSHVFDEQAEWLRRRIGDPASIASVYLRGGTLFIAITVAVAFALTLTASSAPLAGAWNGVGGQLITLSRSLAKFLPNGGDSRPIGLDFGPDTQVSGQWSTSQDLALLIERPPTDRNDYYWRAGTWDILDLKGWSQSSGNRADRAADAALLEGLDDDVDPLGRRSLTFTVSPGGAFPASTIVSPDTPVKVDEATRVSSLGPGYFVNAERVANSGSYTVTALVGVKGNDPGQWNAAALRAAAPSVDETDYPPEIQDYYLSVPQGSLGPDATLLRAKVRAEARSLAPVDLAEQIVKELQEGPYEYDTDIRDRPCETLSLVECFARYKEGYCQYYAATMAILLRDMGIPTRIAQGFLPGSREGAPGMERVLVSQAHAWVEVWFPDYGWVTFDPTGGPLTGQIGPLPSGPVQASASPRASGSVGPAASRPDRLEGEDEFAGSVSGRGQSSVGPLIAVAALLLVAVGAIAFVAWRRSPRGPTTAEGAYGMVAWLATRFGFGPRPTQTVYEFAGSLGEVLPDSRPELETVARAKVESVYARQVLAGDRLEQVRDAQRRLRVALLRLAFRRKERRRR